MYSAKCISEIRMIILCYFTLKVEFFFLQWKKKSSCMCVCCGKSLKCIVLNIASENVLKTETENTHGEWINAIAIIKDIETVHVPFAFFFKSLEIVRIGTPTRKAGWTFSKLTEHRLRTGNIVSKLSVCVP